MNYVNYFTEIETRFQQRRGTLLLLSTLDWALIETWREAGVPLAAVLQGIDDAFDRYDQRRERTSGRLRKVNGLAWCAQAVMQSTEAMRDAAVGAAKPQSSAEESGFDVARIAVYLRGNASQLEAANDTALRTIAQRLRLLADDATLQTNAEALETTLTALEERMFAALMLAANEDNVIALRAQAARELAPYRGKMGAVQLKQVTEQFLHKRLMESRGLPRLSLFYMGVE